LQLIWNALTLYVENNCLFFHRRGLVDITCNIIRGTYQSFGKDNRDPMLIEMAFDLLSMLSKVGECVAADVFRSLGMKFLLGFFHASSGYENAEKSILKLLKTLVDYGKTETYEPS
jgi:hypothetical protein